MHTKIAVCLMSGTAYGICPCKYDHIVIDSLRNYIRTYIELTENRQASGVICPHIQGDWH